KAVIRRAGAHQTPQVDPVLGIQAQEPHSVSSDATAIAASAKGGGGRRDDTERGPVRQDKFFRRGGGRSGALARLHTSVMALQHGEYIRAREHPFGGPQRR